MAKISGYDAILARFFGESAARNSTGNGGIPPLFPPVYIFQRNLPDARLFDTAATNELSQLGSSSSSSSSFSSFSFCSSYLFRFCSELISRGLEIPTSPTRRKKVVVR